MIRTNLNGTFVFQIMYMKYENNKNIDYRVCIYMSTYNGEKYIQNQIESILNQEKVDVQIWIRDDGSTDNTKEIIQKYVAKGRVYLRSGDNVGFEKSFALISREQVDADFYAFSDQDDEWETDRLINAITKIRGRQAPALYGSNLWITNSNLRIERSLYSQDEAARISILMHEYGIFGENMYACTMVWNKELQDLLVRHMPMVRVSQDVWTQLVAEIVGADLIFDSQETIKHRIHGNNTAGIAKNGIQRIHKAIRIYIRSNISTKYQIVREAMNVYSQDYRTKEEGCDSKMYMRILVGNYQQDLRLKVKLVFSRCFREKKFQRRVFAALLVMINKY